MFLILFSVCREQRGSVPGSRPVLRGPAARHICQRCHPSRVPNRRAHEVQKRLQVQDRLR